MKQVKRIVLTAVVIAAVALGYGAFHYAAKNSAGQQGMASTAGIGTLVTGQQLNYTWTISPSSKLYIAPADQPEKESILFPSVWGFWDVDTGETGKVCGEGKTKLKFLDAGSLQRSQELLSPAYFDSSKNIDAEFTWELLGKLPSEWRDGTASPINLAGTLTLRGVTQQVDWKGSIKHQNGQLLIDGDAPVRFQDFGMASPFSSQADNGNLRLQFVLDKPFHARSTAQSLSSSQVFDAALHSEALNKNMLMTVYLPKGYNPETKYPVFYFFHGLNGRYRDMHYQLKMTQLADELMQTDTIQPFLIVAPQIDNSYGINSGEQTQVLKPGDQKSFVTGKYGDYIFKELIPFIEKEFHTASGKEGRYIGGISMGGFIALHSAFRNPEMFSKVGGHSAAEILSDTPLVYPNEQSRRERNPLLLAEANKLDGLSVYLDYGDKDDLKRGGKKLYEVLQKKGVKSEYHESPGGHAGDYSIAHAKDYLLFYGGKE